MVTDFPTWSKLVKNVLTSGNNVLSKAPGGLAATALGLKLSFKYCLLSLANSKTTLSQMYGWALL